MTLHVEIDPLGVLCMFILICAIIVIGAVMSNAKHRDVDRDDE